MENPNLHYSLTELAKETRIGENILRSWKTKGWLEGAKLGGEHEKFTMEEFRIAKEMNNREVRRSKLGIIESIPESFTSNQSNRKQRKIKHKQSSWEMELRQFAKSL